MARMSTGSVQVSGLDRLSRDLREIDKLLARELTKANKGAAKVVATRAAARARSLGSTAAHAADSVKPTAGGAWAGVALGNTAHPEAAGAEFGSHRFKQFQPWTGNGPDAGYFLYPTIRDDDHEWLAEYEDALDEVIRKAGLR